MLHIMQHLDILEILMFHFTNKMILEILTCFRNINMFNTRNINMFQSFLK